MVAESLGSGLNFRFHVELDCLRGPEFATSSRRLGRTLVEWVTGGHWVVERPHGKTVTIGPNTVFTIPPLGQHRLRAKASRDMRSNWALLSFGLPSGTDLFEGCNMPLLPKPSLGARLIKLLTRLCRESGTGDSNPDRVTAKQHVVGFQILDILLTHATMTPRPRGDPRIDKVTRYIMEHLARPLTRSALARIAGLSPTRFHFVFKEATGSAPMAHLQDLRMQRAQELLISSQIPIHEIARNCGFLSAYYFSRMFRKYAGSTPSEFRQQLTVRQG